MTPSFIVYRASAGSGKTFTLAAEYIALLLMNPVGNEFQHILAVTFTNMATAEMKDRIIEYLYALAHNHKGIDSLKEKVIKILQTNQTFLSDDEIQKRAAKSLKNILHDYSHFRVETIDSFFQSVLRNLAHELGLNSNFQVELDANTLVERAVDRMIEKLRDDVSDNIKQTITLMLERKVSEGASWNVMAVVKQFANCIYNEEFQSRTEAEQSLLRSNEEIKNFIKSITAIYDKTIADFKNFKQKAISQIESQELNISRISNARWYINPFDKMEVFDFIPSSISSSLKTMLYEDSSKLLRSADKNVPRFLEMAESTANLLCKVYANYLDSLRVVLASKLTLKYIYELSLLGRIEDECEAICDENNQFSLSKTPVLLQKLVGTNDSPFVFEKAGTQFHHIMIDEFQDTSQMQWQNFKVLLLNNLSAGGMGLLVGDVKQSIYRWRNGDWKILHQISETKGLPAKPQIKPLDFNYRSSKVVIDFNNSFFCNVAKTLDKSIETNLISQIYNDVKQQTKKTDSEGFVRLKLYNGNTLNYTDYQREMAKDMISQIYSLQSLGVSLESIAILVRTRSNGAELISQFEELNSGITLVSDEAFLLNASISVQMLVNALRVLVAPSNNDPVALHYLCFHYLLDIKGESNPLQNDSLIKHSSEILPKSFINHFQELAHLPLYLLCERLYQIFDLQILSGQNIYVLSFFDELQRYLRTTQTDIKSFLKAWDEHISNTPIPSGNISGVRIITIHKSKGLQYHTVFVPSTHWEISRKRSNDRLWCLADDKRFNTLGKLPIDIVETMQYSSFSQNFVEEQLQRRVDAINLLYVAFTRAECNLFVWGETKAKVNNELTSINLSSDLLLSYVMEQLNQSKVPDEFPIEYSIGKPIGLTTEKKKEISRMSTLGEPLEIPVSSYTPNLNFRQSNESIKFIRTLESDKETQSYTDIGKIMHYVLSKIQTIDQVQTTLEQCKIDGLIENEKVMGVILKRLSNGFNNPLIQNWFSTNVQIYNECSIVGRSEKNPQKITHRPDRVVISSGTITVIDYKFARKDNEHIKQVQGYMELLQKMHPEMNIEGYLWYIYSNELVPVSQI